MRFEKMGIALQSEDPAASARFFTEHLGFRVAIDLDWYVSLHHDEHPGYIVDFVRRGHEAMPESLRTQSPAGLMLGLLVADAVAAEAELRAAGVEIVGALVDEPWGQRRFHVRAPDGIVCEILQTIEPDPEWMRQNGY
ncbi:hypothetical protein CFN78_01995 [Amycolatopsis antarctica]|uniref:VOC domain-containing protein n=1 Tax=Amycolatopsis antarctica TaxID=1854586 RepID=A0A263DBW2_9PSEU|nr:VOC family protein [Amycolatopsis antarctica]OZM74987.1 hypothetical protein CFN78_01995 [Amycolatopsis antarctica]